MAVPGLVALAVTGTLAGGVDGASCLEATTVVVLADVALPVGGNAGCSQSGTCFEATGAVVA